VTSLADLDVGEGDVQALTAIREPDTVEIVRHVRELGGAIELESCGMRLSAIAPLFTPSTRWAASEETVAVMGSARFELDLYRPPGFELTKRIRRSLPAIRATEEIARETVGEGMRVMGPGGERICDASEVVEKRGFLPEIPPVTRLALSPAGEFFLERWARKGEDRLIDVLDPDGEYQGTLAPGFPFPDAFLGEDRIVVKEEDELGRTSLAVLRVTR
jgi:hypothetical protein